jgi:hypothetical protein
LNSVFVNMPEIWEKEIPWSQIKQT